MAKTKKFYFTYSNNGEHPFDSGFTVVYAEDFGEATEKFCKRHPPRFPGLMCCAAMYSDEAFRKTDMYLGGNYGRHEVEIIE